MLRPNTNHLHSGHLSYFSITTCVKTGKRVCGEVFEFDWMINVYVD